MANLTTLFQSLVLSEKTELSYKLGISSFIYLQGRYLCPWLVLFSFPFKCYISLKLN
jgi:hypothetical protein